MVCRFWKCLDVSIITPRWLNRGLSSIVMSETLNCINNVIDHACTGVLLYSTLSYKWTETVTFPSSDLKTIWLNVSRPVWVKLQGHSIYVKQWPSSPFNAPKTEFADSFPVEVVKESTKHSKEDDSGKPNLISLMLTRFISIQSQLFISTGNSDGELWQILCNWNICCTGVKRHWALEDDIRIAGDGLLQRVTGSVGSLWGELEAGWVNGEDLAADSDGAGHRPEQLCADAGVQLCLCDRRQQVNCKE